MKKETNNFNFFSLSTPNPGTPQVNEIFGSQDWIKFGDDNLWPQELIRLYQNSSPLHSGLIKKKVDMMVGLGFNPTAGLEPFLGNEYSKDDLNTIIYKCGFDLVIHGGFYLNVIWSKGGKQIAQLEHVSYEKVRCQKPDEETEVVENYYISKDWSRTRRTENTPKIIHRFCPEHSTEFPSQLLSVMTYTPGIEYYSLPDYMAVINWLKLDYEIGVFHLKSVQNGFMPGMIIINKAGVPPAEEREKIYKDLKERYAGAKNAGDFIMVFAENDASKPEFQPIQLNNSDEKFINLMIQMNQEILIGHGATSPVAGIETSGKLGSADEIKDAYMIFQKTKIAQFQEIVERAINKLAKINGYTEKLTLVVYSIFPEDIKPVPEMLQQLFKQDSISIEKVIESIKWLEMAISRHERHMSGDEDTGEDSQMLMMDEMKKALDYLLMLKNNTKQILK